MYKNKKTIEEEFDFNFCDELGFCNDTKQRDLLEYIHQIRQDDLEEVKKIIKEKGLHLGYGNDILEKLNNLNK
jgi:hypothetical protein